MILSTLLIGDIVTQGGVELVCRLLPGIRQKFKLNFIVANGENMHEGKGFNEPQVKLLLNAGVDVVTGGDHSFDKHLIFPFMAKEPRLLRPYNYPPGVPGRGYGIYPIENSSYSAAVINMRGQTFFTSPIQCPFRTIDQLLPEIVPKTPIIIIDFHAEATAEKYAFAWHLHDRVSVIVGTHTHVPTADAQIFPGGMGYITDLGFTGPHHSAIGMDIETSINRNLLQIPQKYKPAEEDLRLNACLFKIQAQTGKCVYVEQISFPEYERNKT